MSKIKAGGSYTCDKSILHIICAGVDEGIITIHQEILLLVDLLILEPYTNETLEKTKALVLIDVLQALVGSDQDEELILLVSQATNAYIQEGIL